MRLRGKHAVGRRTARPLGVAVAVLVGLSACDSGPSGPGSISAVVEAPGIGGVVLEVRGSGIRSFSARGSARVYSAATPGRPAAHRVVVITPAPGELAFDVEVDDVGMDGPVVTVIAATDGENGQLRTSDVTVRLER